jgi:hypothetical protein
MSFKLVAGHGFGIGVAIISFFRVLFALDGIEPVALKVAPNADSVITGAEIVSLGFGLLV